jgi:UDP-N-acetylglucosamine 1-carboxyvinyltransferase
MDLLRIEGGRRLKGTVTVHGSKNAALPCLVAALLCDGESTLDGVPQVEDVRTMTRLLGHLGVRFKITGHRISLTGRTDVREAPDELVRAMRASFLVLGPLLARHGEARVPLPGGCAIGARPVDMHLRGLSDLGAEVQVRGGVVEARARRLSGAEIYLDQSSVGATCTLLLAATLARGRTAIENAAREPEVEELGRVLNKMGARIHGAGTDLIVVDGVASLFPYSHTLMTDRIEAGTYLCAAAMARGDVLVEGCRVEHLEAAVHKLRSAGLEVEPEGGGLRVRRRRDVKAIRVRTGPYPGFPTDLQPLFTALCCTAPGTSVVTDLVFGGRFTHVAELRRMGAHIEQDGHTLLVHGGAPLTGAAVEATDLRQAASLALLGLAAEGQTRLLGAELLDRGYEDFVGALRGLGAEVVRERGNTRPA